MLAYGKEMGVAVTLTYSSATHAVQEQNLLQGEQGGGSPETDDAGLLEPPTAEEFFAMPLRHQESPVDDGIHEDNHMHEVVEQAEIPPFARAGGLVGR